MAESEGVMQELAERWQDLTSYVTEEVRKRWWDRIVNAYSEPHRKYHTLYHIYQMFQHYDQNKDFLTDRYACAYAIFFHDIVYDPLAKDNEAQSAAVLREYSKETTLDSSSYVANLIEASASHCTEAHMDPNSYGSDDSHYFLDFDMAILGADPDEYDQYRQKIREEYNHLDAPIYAQERSKVLRMFLQIPNIYATKEFRESYEAKARANIQREIDLLAATST